MYGKLTDAWPYTWELIWVPLSQVDHSPVDLFMQLYADLRRALKETVENVDIGRVEGQQASVENDPDEAQRVFLELRPEAFRSDVGLRHFFESAFETLDDFEIRGLTACYRQQLARFLVDLNLRYRLTEDDILVPHVPGIVAMLASHVEDYSRGDEKLRRLLLELENSLANLSRLPNQSNAKGWITRSSVYTEGLAQVLVDSTQSLGKLCRNPQLFPHKALADALSQLYGFCSDYVGLRHAGNIEGYLRDVDLRDAVSIAIILHGLSGYLLPAADFADIVGLEDRQRQ